MKDNKKGSTLVAAIVIIMVIMVILGAALTIASSYYKNSINDITKKQVYLSAKSGGNLLASYISDNNVKLIPLKSGEEIVVNDISVEGDKTTKSGVVRKVDDTTLKITVTATSDEDSYKIQIVMKYKDYKWSIHSYCEGKDGDTLC